MEAGMMGAISGMPQSDSRKNIRRDRQAFAPPSRTAGRGAAINQDLTISMQASLLRLTVAATVGFVLSGLAGCGTINEQLTVGLADHVPQWAGGLPANAPPRPGTAKYDAYMREQERLRTMPAAEREKLEAAKAAETGQPAAPSAAR
jgi:hypothetical protein